MTSPELILGRRGRGDALLDVAAQVLPNNPLNPAGLKGLWLREKGNREGRVAASLDGFAPLG